MSRSPKSPPNNQPRVRTLIRSSLPKGKVIIVSRGHQRANITRKLPPCLKAHRVTRIVP